MNSEITLPGLELVRNAIRKKKLLRLPKSEFRQDVIAGLSSALSNVSDGMANGALLGVNPINGLYGAIFGPTLGGIFSQTKLMMVTTMAAASLTASQALGDLSGEARSSALFAMVTMIGVFQILAGFLGFAKLLKFVSYSVITGFLTGVSVLLILNQLSDVTGLDLSSGVKGALELLFRIPSVNLPTFFLAALTLLLAVVLPRTRVSNFGRLIAVVTPSLLVLIFGFEDVKLVRDLGEIPSGFSLPSLPTLEAFTPEVLTGALAVSIIILVQSAGVGQSVPVQENEPPNPSRDFKAIGLANVASGCFGGLPVGGSVSGTALNILYGAQTRWASIFAGLFMTTLVLFFSRVVGYITMPALGALLILAGLTSIHPQDIRLVHENGWPARLAGLTTFVAMFFFPIQVAVGVGVVISAFLSLVSSSSDISIVELVEKDNGKIEEKHPPRNLPSNTVTVLDVYGHLFFAGAKTLERLLPRPVNATRPVVVLRLRGRTSLGATLDDVLIHYAEELRAKGGRLFLSGLHPKMLDHISHFHAATKKELVRTFEATPIRGESTRQAVREGELWLLDSTTKEQL